MAGVGKPDPERLLAELGGGFDSDMDRYRDFRAVFLSDERGKRVLHEILGWAHVYRTSVVGRPIDPHQTSFREGERNLALRILTTINAEPAERPTRTRGDV